MSSPKLLGMQDLERNKQTVRSLYEQVLSGHRPELADALFAPAAPAASEFRAALTGLIHAFSDIHYTLLDLVAEGDRVAARWQWNGTFSAPFRGFAPTQAAVSDTGIAIFTFSDGRIASVDLQTDRLGFLQQIGVVPEVTALRGAPPVIDARRAPDGVYLIDTFVVPAAARSEFETAMRRNREYIRTLAGFRGDAVLARKQGESFDIATIAVWESPAALARAKDQAAAFYQRIGFDMPAAIASWGVTLQRSICEAPAALQ
ncbi:MAG TPA: ester cyclase [Polyangiaceae bacterium]|jgi:predicted ester cyclase|nr:ester cyclase [Polyangiaceae bacterium]